MKLKTFLFFVWILLFANKDVSAQSPFTQTSLAPFNTANFISFVIDYDNDGDDDVVGWQSHILNSAKLYRNNGDNTFSDVSTNMNFPDFNDGVARDIDNNGYTDIYYLSSRDTLRIIFNDGLSFSTPGASCSSFLYLSNIFSTNSIDIGKTRIFDYNGDGVYDIITWIKNGPVGSIVAKSGLINCSACRYGLSPTPFQTLVSFTSSIESEFQFGDVDNDGDFDLLVGQGNQFQNSSYSVYANLNGNFSLLSNTGFAMGRTEGFGTMGEFNNDGITDILSGAPDCCVGNNPLYMYFSSGPAAFNASATAMQRSLNPYYGNPVVVDINLDKRQDVVWAGMNATGSSALQCFINNGDNSFTESAASLGINYGPSNGDCCPLKNYQQSTLIDLNNDKKPDLDIHEIDAVAPHTVVNRWQCINSSTNNSVKLKLIACKGLKEGWGARIKYKAGSTWTYLQHNGYSGANYPFLYLGMGSSIIIDSIVVDWIGGVKTVATNIAASSYLVMKENATCVMNSEFDPTIFAQDTLNICAENFTIDAGAGYAAYNWNTGDTTQTIAINASGLYTVNVSNAAGCTAGDSVYLNLVNANILQSDTAICRGQTMTLCANPESEAVLQGVVPYYNNVNPLPEILNNVWSYVAITKGLGNNAKFYINGQLRDSGFYANFIYSWSHINLGARNYNGYGGWFKGWIDEIKMSNVSRDGIYFQNNYDLSAPFTSDANTIGLWHFDESIGNTTAATVGQDGNLTNGIFTQGRFGNSIYYNGLNAYTNINQAVPVNNMSFEFWIKPDSIVTSWPISWGPMYIAGFLLEKGLKNSSYLWSTGDTSRCISFAVDSTSSYTLAVTNGLTTCYDTINITVPILDTSINSSGPTTFCAGDSVVLSAGNASAYQWLLNNSPIQGANTQSYTATQNGDYKVILTSSLCTDTSVVVTVNAGATITTQPNNVVVCNGDSATFSVSMTSPSLSYQWQVSTNSGASFTNISNAVSPTLTGYVTSSMNGYRYRVIVTGCGTPITSSSALLTVNLNTTILNQPSSVSTCAGSNAIFSVNASGSTASYQWQVSANGGATYSNVPNATSASLNILAVTSLMSGYRYRAMVSSCGGPIASSAAILTVNASASITNQPASLSVCAGDTAFFSVTAVSASSYQWQESTNGGTSYSNMPYAPSSPVLQLYSDLGLHNNRYRVIVSGCNSTITSSSASLTVNASATITTQPNNVVVCSGDSANFSVVPSSPSFSYQWQRSTNGGASYSNITNAFNPILTQYSVTSLMNGYRYRVIVSGCGSPVTSSAAMLTVNSTPAIITQPANLSVCVGDSARFSVTTSGSSLNYQWQLSTNGGTTYSNISGATSSSLMRSPVTVSMNNYRYRVIVSGCGTPGISSAATLTVNATASITTQPTSVSVCTGSSTNFAIDTSGPGLTYQWQVSTNSGVSYSNISGATSTNLNLVSVDSSMNGYRYRVIVSGCGAPVVSSSAVLTVYPTAAITNQPLSVSVCADSAAAFSITTSGANATYQWQVSTNGGSTYSNINNATTTTLNLSSVTSQMNNYSYRVIVSFPCGNITSAMALLNVSTIQAMINLPQFTTICNGSGVTLSADTSASYQWYINGNILVGATNRAFYATQAGGYSVVVTNSNGCVSAASNPVNLSFIAPPTAAFNFSNACVNDSVKFTNISTPVGGSYTYNWDFGDSTTASWQSPTHIYAQQGNYLVRLTASSPACPNLVSTVVKTVSVVAPANQRYPTRYTLENIPVQLDARTVVNATYKWLPATGLNNSSIKNPVFNYNRDMEYLIKISSPNACMITDTLKIIISKETGIFVPQGFSPNGDGQNDFLVPILLGIKEMNFFRVYNRWGQLIFETKVAGIGWDGTYKGTKQPIDTYTWYVEGLTVDGKIIKKKGGTLLIK